MQAITRGGASGGDIPIGDPIKIMAGLVSANDTWRLSHCRRDAIAAEVPGKWADYSLTLSRSENGAMLCIEAEPDIFIADAGMGEAGRGIIRLNRALLLGHFDLHVDDGRVVFRHAMPMRGTGGATPEQIEDLVEATLTECERAYPALFQIATGMVAAETAVATALMETAGTA